MILTYDSKTRKVQKNNGEEISLIEAEDHWRNGVVVDHNLAFQRLVNNNFNPEAVDAQYREIRALESRRQ